MAKNDQTSSVQVLLDGKRETNITSVAMDWTLRDDLKIIYSQFNLFLSPIRISILHHPPTIRDFGRLIMIEDHLKRGSFQKGNSNIYVFVVITSRGTHPVFIEFR